MILVLACLWLGALVEGEHYQVQSDVSVEVAEEALGLLEAAWPQYVERFSIVPQEKLRIFIHQNRDSYRRGPEQAEVPWPDSAGFVHPTHMVVHVEYGPGEDYRRLLLHEAAHQFHYHAPGEASKWYTEGVAHDLERHRFEDGRLRIGVGDLAYGLGLEERGLALLEQGGPEGLARCLRGEEASWIAREVEHRSLGYILVRFFRGAADEQDRFWFREFEQTVAEGRRPPPPPSAEAALFDQVRDFAESLQRPATSCLGEWTREGDTCRAVVVAGDAPKWPLLKMPENGSATLRFTVGSDLLQHDSIGFVLGRKSYWDMTAMVIKSRGQELFFATSTDGEWGEARWSREERGSSLTGTTLELRVDTDGHVSLSRNGQLWVEHEVEPDVVRGHLGLWAESADSFGANQGIRVFEFERVSFSVVER